MSDARRHSPAVARNRAPLLAALRAILPDTGVVLEVASGGGEHIVHFARALPDLIWQPSDPAAEARASIAAWAAAEEPLPNLRAPLDLDAAAATWPIAAADALLCVNMIHIAPWAATEGLMRGAARLLPAHAPLVLYGPFLRAGVATAPGNLAFDADLRRRDPRWGVRDFADVSACATRAGLTLDRVIAMPADNLVVLFRRDG